ncbi:MAG: peptidase [Planctomycetes bacterium]|nr:peptidase [Planctomycetota bacterium]
MPLPALVPTLLAAVIAQPAPPPSALPGFEYTQPFFPGAAYDNAIPTPDSLLGFPVGQKPATHAQIEACMKAWANTPRSRLFEYARSHEGKTLYYLVISSKKNIDNLAALKTDIAALADPRTGGDADALAKQLPAVAWMAYVIHGDEMSGSDASLALAHHLIASTEDATAKLLDNVIVIIDPLMNPDGRDRYISQLTHDRTAQPGTDDQSVLHSRPWPAGRTNHYLFDLNRDWIMGVHPETRGRVKAIGEWHPQLFMESHEMGSQDTFLFSPPREPVNPNLAPTMKKWWDAFGSDLAGAFDVHQWRYYHGEWNEEWYPGYSSAWAGYRGAIDILFEQASIATDAVRKGSGVLETYRESVHHQLVASMANLRTLAANREGILADYLAQRRFAVSADSPFAKRTYAIVPGPNASRVRTFIDTMRLQGFEVFTAGEAFKASGKDQLGRDVADREFPAGTILIPNRQPEARLLAAMLEFDTRMSDDFLKDEYRELLRFGRSKLYDVTGWSMSMLHGVEAYELKTALPDKAAPFAPPPTVAPIADVPAATAFVIDGADDLSVAAAGRLMERGVRCRAADKPFAWGGVSFARGSIVVSVADNRLYSGDLKATVAKACEELGLQARASATGLGPGEDPDIGGEHFVLLEQPRIAVLSRDPFSVLSFGETWYLLDHTLGVRATYLDTAELGGADLRRYNVLIVPEGGGDTLKPQLDTLRAWVKGGGTLIAIGGSAAFFATEATSIGGARQIQDVITKMDDYALAISREWEGRQGAPLADQVWSFLAPKSVAYPWTPLKSDDKPSDDEAKRRDAFRALFMPTGAVLAARVDDRSWLTAGCGDFVPVMMGQGPVLMAAAAVQAPVRFGVYSPAPPPPAKPEAPKAESKPADSKDKPDKDKSDKDDKDEPKGPPPHWAPLPAGQELRLRMAGLLWPHAADRLADAAFVTRESVGAGQVILFADSPTFRGSAKGTTRIMSNAAILGPGMGASQPIRLKREE